MQNYNNHARYDPPFHFGFLLVLMLTWIGAGVNLYHSWNDHQRLYSASLIFVLTFCVMVAALYARGYALKAQDRAIRAEENLRHYLLAGKLMDQRLKLKQIVALRFASDAELVELSRKAAESNMEPKSIKQAIQNWRADLERI